MTTATLCSQREEDSPASPDAEHRLAAMTEPDGAVTLMMT
jgi:hypothetical protein